jgi:two-component system, NtrC family, sensor histidine kinase KinB
MNWSDLSILAALLIVLAVGVGLVLYWIRGADNQAMMDSMTDAIVILNRHHYIIQANLKAEQILGQSTGTIVKQPINTTLGQLADMFDPHEQAAARELILGQEDNKRYYDCRITPLHGRSGRFRGWLLVLRDVTDSRQTAQSLRAQKELFESLVAVARATSEMPTLESTLQNALDVAAQLTGAEYGSLILLDRQENVTQSIIALGRVSLAQKGQMVNRVMTRGLAGWVAQKRESALIYDTMEDERWLPAADNSYTARSALAVPILSSATLLGVLTLTHSEPRRFTAEHAYLMQAAADQVSLAVRNAQMYDEMRHYASDLNTLYTVTQTVGRSLELEDVLAQTLFLILDSLQFEAGLICLADAQSANGRERLNLIAHERMPLPIVVEFQQMGFAQTLPGLAQKRREALFISDSQNHEADDLRAEIPKTFTMMEEMEMRAAICIPLIHQEQSLGILCLFDRTPRPFSTDDIALQVTVGQQIATAIANARLFRAAVDERSQLQALIESSRDGIILISNEQRVLIINPPALAILRLHGRSAAWVNRPFLTLIEQFNRHAPAAANTLSAEMERSLKNHKATGSGEFELGSRHVHWLNLPVNAGQEPLGRLLFLRDVTEEHTLEQMRDDLIHTTVHDLRNPLTGIFSALEFLEHDIVNGVISHKGLQPNENYTPTDHRQLIQIARTNARRMLKLVNTILDINRLETGNMPINHEAMPVPELVEEALDSQLPLALEKEITLTKDIAPDLPLAWGDRSLIDRVLQNLIGNGIKFTPIGGEVQVIVRQVGTEKQWLQFSVIDNGAGIPIQIQPRLFQQFTTGGQKERGSGLGLAFCRMAIKAHDELIWAENKPGGGGAVFHFTLPLAAQTPA